MTVKEFKVKYPQFSHLEGDALWNKMEDTLLKTGDVYVPETNGEPFSYKTSDGIEIIMMNTLTWKNVRTGKIVTDEELHPKPDTSKSPLESWKMEFLDFGKDSR